MEQNQKIMKTHALSDNIQKNLRAIETLKSELNVLEDVISKAEEDLMRAKGSIENYQERTKKILKMDKEMSQYEEIPDELTARFDEIVREAQFFEQELSKIGIKSEEDYLKKEKSLKDKKQLLNKYTEMMNNIEKQNQHIVQLAKTRIENDKEQQDHKNALKNALIDCNQTYGIALANFKDLTIEIDKTENKIKHLLTMQRISRRNFECFREVEEHLMTYEALYQKGEELKQSHLDENGFLKTPAEKETYFQSITHILKEMMEHYEIMYRNNVLNREEFYVKDKHNKEELEIVLEELKSEDKKMKLLLQISEQCKLLRRA